MALARQVHCGPSCAAVEAHLVPALVEMNGPAAVDKFFRPRPSGATVDGLAVLQCSLRGRSLAGVRLPLPEGYGGAVLECRPEALGGECSGGGGGGDGGERGAGGSAGMCWGAKGTFSHLHYFNHDAAPLRGDPLRRCLEWAALAGAVHAPIDSSAVDAALQQQQQEAAMAGERGAAAAGASQ